MIFQIDISDGSNELKELQHVVSELNKNRAADAAAAGQPAPTPITETQYLTEIALGPLKKKVKQRYISHVQTLSAAELEQKLGPIDDIRSKKP
jgi:hypothetical protein